MKTVIISDVDNTLRRQNVETETSRVGLDFTFLMPLWPIVWTQMKWHQKPCLIPF